MEPPTTDPYAPPKSTATGTNNTTYLEHDGYAFQNELVANHHFKSPLICAKLGIHIPAESNPKPKEITVTRVSRFTTSTISIITLVSFLSVILIIFYIDFNWATPTIIIYIISARILSRLFSKPYQIPFYFSEHYTRIRARRKLIFALTFFTLIVIFIYGFNMQHESSIIFSFFAFLLTLLICKFKTTYFTVTDTKGDYHYIRGVHQNLLNELPHLPLSS